MKTLGAECPVFPMATGRATGTVANPLPKNKAILLTFLISKRYLPYIELQIKVKWLHLSVIQV